MVEIVLTHKLILICTAIIFSLDFVTGLTKALYNKNFSSEKFRKTIPKLISYLSIFVIAGVVEIYFNTTVIISGCATFIIVTEATSIIENINEFVNVPEILTKFLDTQKDNNE